MFFDGLLGDVHFQCDFPLGEAVELLQLEGAAALVWQAGDDMFKSFKLKLRSDPSIRAGLLTGDAQRIDFPQSLHGDDAGATGLLYQEVTDDCEQVATAVADGFQADAAQAGVGVLDQVVDVRGGEPVDAAPQPRPHLAFMGKDVGGYPFVSR